MDQEAVERPTRTNSSLGRAAFVFVILIAAITLSYFFLDRQLAIALRPYTNGVPFFVWLTYISTPLAPSASILAAFISGRALARGHLTDTESAFLRASSAILI
jgi:D-serine deaminase-like pyridoxal phosphate-dependent protein